VLHHFYLLFKRKIENLFFSLGIDLKIKVKFNISDLDFFIKEQLEELEGSVDLTLFKSFSRDGNKNKYVQHSMKENEKLILDLLLNHNASIYVAGNSKNMPNGTFS
jgi:hypothetical protein